METKSLIPFPVYNYKIHLIFTDDLTGSADRLAKKGFLKYEHGIDDTTGAFTVRMPNQSNTFMVFKYDADINHIVHETYHAVTNMFNWIGAKQEEEIFAYSFAYVVELTVNDQEKSQKKFKKPLTKKKK